jgi:threonyl-tRNA synthetase
MKCLLLHCRAFRYKLDHPTAVADSIDNVAIKAEYENAAVVFIAVEAADALDLLRDATIDIHKFANKCNASIIIINPFAHLSSGLAGSTLAKELLTALVARLTSTMELPIAYTGFGWYKSFMTDVEGHSCSQAFRSYFSGHKDPHV